MLRRLPLALLVPLLLAPAALAGVSERAYDRAVDLVERLYLYPEDVQAPALLEAAARNLAEEVDWLVVEVEGGAVLLAHGSGAPVGAVSVASLKTLPEALRSLEEVVADAGYDTGDADLRLALLQGMTDALDRYSKVLSGDRLERFDVRLKGTLEGIGATLRVEAAGLVIKSLVPGGPAEVGGVRPGDVVERIDGVSTVNMSQREAVRRIRGEAGTEVVLSIRRGEGALELALERAEVVVPTVSHEVLPGPVGYVEIDHFSQRTEENLVQALEALRVQGALGRGLVIDLRHNTGGSMKESARTADLFVEEGLLLRTAGADGGRVQNLQSRMDASDSGQEPPIPVVLLVDERTASGSEILAGALLELERAALVGTRTYGKGSVQKIYTLDPEARLKLTVARYLLANERDIHEGIVPDEVLADIELDAYGVRYRGWHEDKAGVAFEDILPVVREEEGWRGREQDPGDLALEIARRAVLRARGSSRYDVLQALDEVLPEVRDEQERSLVEALEARDIDWSPAPEDGSRPRAAVRVRAFPDPDRADVVAVEVEVDNQGRAPLHRALVQLESDSFSAWDGLVIPVGRVPPGGTARGAVSVPLRPGIHPRQDEVQVLLRAHRRPTLRAGETWLEAASSDEPLLAATARLLDAGPRRMAVIEVHNLSQSPVTGLEASFAHPGDIDVELVDAAVRAEVLAGGSEARLDLSLRVGPDAPAAIPLELVLEGERYGTLARWPLSLPLGGEPVEVRPPRVTARQVPLSAPAGPVEVELEVRDERALHHAVLYANGEKVGWAGGGGSRAVLRVPVPVEPGFNLLVAVAEDDQGLRTREQFVIRGVGETAAVDAGE